MANKLDEMQTRLNNMMDSLDKHPTRDDTPVQKDGQRATRKGAAKPATPKQDPQGLSNDQLKLIKALVEPIVSSINTLTESHNDLKETITSQKEVIDSLQASTKLNSEAILKVKKTY